MKSNKIKNINSIPDTATSFADKLCTYLNDPIIDSCLNIRYFHQQCAGITGKRKRCRHKLKVEVAYDAAESDPPVVCCHMHCNNTSTTLHLVIQEVRDPTTGTITHRCAGISTDMPQLNDADTKAYQILNYYDDPTPRTRLLDGGRVGLGYDKEVWIDPDTRIRIYYVREAGRIWTTQVSARTQLAANIQSYKIAVEAEMVVAGHPTPFVRNVSRDSHVRKPCVPCVGRKYPA